MTSIEWTERTAKRFWAKVDRRGPDDCWQWLAGVFQGNGYGQFRAGRRKVKAHRFAYVIEHGDVPDGKILCHRCDNRLCCNPAHLYAGTHADNARDREERGRGAQVAGALNPAAKLTAVEVDDIRRRRTAGESQASVARRYGVHPNHVGRIFRGERRAHG